MSHSQMDFFDRLELDLRAAAERRPRRLAGWAPVTRLVAAAALALTALALALVPVLALLGGGDEGAPSGSDRPRPLKALPPVGTVVERHGEEQIVVAIGIAPVAGPWQMETYKSDRIADPQTGEVYQPAGLRCLGVFLPYARGGSSGGGQCGEFPRTPDFSRVQHTVRDAANRAREVLVYGRVPEDAAAVVIRRPGERQLKLRLREGPPDVRGDFYLVALPANRSKGRVNWLDRNGDEGSRGIALLPL